MLVDLVEGFGVVGVDLVYVLFVAVGHFEEYEDDGGGDGEFAEELID